MEVKNKMRKDILDVTIEVVPFSWNDEMAEEAQEVFEEIRDKIGYGHRAVLGTALAKLKLLEKQGAKVDEHNIQEE